MAANILRKLLGRTPSLPADAAEAVEELTRLIAQKPALAGPASLLLDILPAIYAHPVPHISLNLTQAELAKKQADGQPALRSEAVPMDLNKFKERWSNVCSAVQRQQESPAPVALADAIRRGAIDPQQLVIDVLNGRADAVHARADELGLDAGLTATVLRLSLYPVLSQANVACASLRSGQMWAHGYCPTCGSWPLLGEFRGLEQIRFLRCGLCAAEWEFPRLRCPYCGNTDHRMLGYFQAEGEDGKARAATCDVCRGYVKVLSSLVSFSPPRLLVADLATMHLDLIAAEKGYTSSPPTSSDDVNEEML